MSCRAARGSRFRFRSASSSRRRKSQRRHSRMNEPTIAAMIVDDEPLGRDLVRHMLATHPNVRIVSECADGEKALAAIRRHAPGIVFLDIKMPRLDGISLLQQLEPNARPLVV